MKTNAHLDVLAPLQRMESALSTGGNEVLQQDLRAAVVAGAALLNEVVTLRAEVARLRHGNQTASDAASRELLIDFVRWTKCYCMPAWVTLPAFQCERCRLLNGPGHQP